MARYTSLYAIYGPADKSLYVGQTKWLKPRLGRHDHELEDGSHHCLKLLTSYAAAIRKSKPLMVLGLDWDTDERLIIAMEQTLLTHAKVLAPKWKVTNKEVPTVSALEREFGPARLEEAMKRLRTRAVPSLARMKPVSYKQLTGTLESFRVYTSNFG